VNVYSDAYKAGEAAFAARRSADSNPHAGAPETDTRTRRLARMWLAGWHKALPTWPDHVTD